MTAHTPGPWRIERGTGWFYVLAGPVTVADVKDTRSDASEANARLIAAAPDMYEALKEVTDSIVMSDASFWEAIAKCRAALAKAEGQP